MSQIVCTITNLFLRSYYKKKKKKLSTTHEPEPWKNHLILFCTASNKMMFTRLELVQKKKKKEIKNFLTNSSYK